MQMKKTLRCIPVDTISKWMEEQQTDIRIAAMEACKGRSDVPLDIIKRGLADDQFMVRVNAVKACEGRNDISLELVEQGFRDPIGFVCQSTVELCKHLDISLAVIQDWITNKDEKIRMAAMELCKTCDNIPIDTIQEWIDSEDWMIRTSAMNACIYRYDVPTEIIMKGLNDRDCSVADAALKVCEANGISIPLVRTFEPPDLVYKKCIGGVIVVAEIPKDAQVRGKPGGKCRANKAIIKDIIGDLCGEKIGVSRYDKKTAYFIGDEVFVEDFDMNQDECSRGFHFFCSLKEAEVLW